MPISPTHNSLPLQRSRWASALAAKDYGCCIGYVPRLSVSMRVATAGNSAVKPNSSHQLSLDSNQLTNRSIHHMHTSPEVQQLFYPMLPTVVAAIALVLVAGYFCWFAACLKAAIQQAVKDAICDPQHPKL